VNSSCCASAGSAARRTSGASTCWWGREAGIETADLQRLAAGPEADGWSQPERSALRAADQLIERHTLDDQRWAELSRHFTSRQVLDLVFLVGQYQLVCAALNALRVERDDGLDSNTIPFPSTAD
jgi:alkylhydroperoxidase family enzyme